MYQSSYKTGNKIIITMLKFSNFKRGIFRKIVIFERERYPVKGLSRKKERGVVLGTAEK